MRRLRILTASLACTGVAAVIATSANAQTITVTRASVGPGGVEGNGASGNTIWGTRPNQVSSDARYIAFASAASNLVPADTNAKVDVFVHDLPAQTTNRISVSSSGVQANGDSAGPSLSANGRFVAFRSDATNLVSGDTNANPDIFVRDLVLATTTRASLGAGGVQGNGDAEDPHVSDDGRYVCFFATSFNLVSGDTNFTGDIFVRDMVAATTTRVSVSNVGAQSNGWSWRPSISADGRYVVFDNNTALVPGASGSNVFLRDRTLATTSLVSVGQSGGPGDSYAASVSADGRYVAFTSATTDLVTGDTNGVRDAFVRDLVAGTTVRVSLSSGGVQGNAVSGSAAISSDGKWIAFTSDATNLTTGDANAQTDVFLRDLATSTTTLVSRSSAGIQGDSLSFGVSVASNGLVVAFWSTATNLVPSDANGVADVFVSSTCGQTSVYCTAGTTTNGCTASISSSGTPSASSGSGFTLLVTGVEGQRSGLLFYGISGANNSVWGLGSSSFLCAKSPTQRTPAHNSDGTVGVCNGSLSVDWNAFIAANPSALGQPFSSGQLVFAQGWFRDPPAPKTTNLSNALSFRVCP